MSTHSKSGILAFVDRYDQESVWSLRHVGAEIAFERAYTVYMGGYPPSPILVAVGPVGGEKLCRHISDWGIDGVQCVVLVGVTAPRAERRLYCLAPGHTTLRLPLGHLEPLRAVAERARANGDAGDSRPCRCAVCAAHNISFVLACAPDDGMCRACEKRTADLDGARHPRRAEFEIWEACAECSGTGKALSSADVARELMGASNGQPTSHGLTSYRWDCGGITIQVYDTRIDLAKHGLGAAIELAVQK